MIGAWWRLALLAACLASGGCTLERPTAGTDFEVPGQFAEQGDAAEQWPDSSWWQGFAVPELDRLVVAARAGNTDLLAGLARLRQADAQARIAGAALLPTLDASAGSIRTRRTSDNGLTGKGPLVSDSVDLGLVARWEVDIWGANQAARDSALASAASTRFAEDALDLTVTAGVAETYFRLLAQRDRVRIAEANLGNARRVLALVEVRVQNGAASDLDLARQRTQVANLLAVLPVLLQTERQTQNALALLLGRPLVGFDVEGRTLAPVKPVAIITGLPSGLLHRRPDLRAREADLLAAAADIVVARAALYPTIDLTGRAGLTSESLRSILSQTSVLSIATSILAPIFDGGRRRAQVEVSEAQRQELVEAYRGTVLGALADVEDALTAARQSRAREAALERAVREARRAFSLAETQYRNGAIGLFELLDAQRTLFAVEEAVIGARLDRLLGLIDLYRALGGGWTPLSTPVTARTTIRTTQIPA